MNTDAMVSALEAEALEWVSELRKYRVYQGTDPDRFRRARIGLGVVGGYVRLRATCANERSNELIAERMQNAIDVTPERKALPE